MYVCMYVYIYIYIYIYTCIYTKESPGNFTPQALLAGDEVGFLVDLAGACFVYVNNEERRRYNMI